MAGARSHWFKAHWQLALNHLKFIAGQCLSKSSEGLAARLTLHSTQELAPFISRSESGGGGPRSSVLRLSIWRAIQQGRHPICICSAVPVGIQAIKRRAPLNSKRG